MDSSGKRVVVAIFAFAALLAAVAYFGKPVVRIKPQTPSARGTVAVLPFENLDGADSLEIIAANVTAALTEELGGVEAFEVLPRAEVLEYKGLEGGAEEIAVSLGVDYVLAGSVERIDGRLRLQTYFIKPGERPRIWADEYFYDEDEAERIPEDLATRVRHALTGTNNE